MRKFLFGLAALGWTLAVIVHILSIADIDVSETVPFIWILHIGIFVVLIPAIFILRKNVDIKQLQASSVSTRMNPLSFLKIVFKSTPRWLMAIAVIGFLYAIVNFLFFAIDQQGNAM